MKRIAVGQVLQETNRLNRVPTTLAEFEAWGLATADEVMAEYSHGGELAGFARLPEILGERVEWLGLVRAMAWPGGPLTDGAFGEVMDRLVSPLGREPVDGVLLSMHGAQCAQSEPDVTGKALAAVRRVVGDGVPVVVTLDLHANITQRMVREADVLVGYHTFPHVDHGQCGERAARALARMLTTGQAPAVEARKIPMIANDDGRATDRGVLSELWREIVAAEQGDGVASVGLYQAQPWIDVPELGWACYQAYWTQTPPLDSRALADACWATRDYAGTEFLSPEQAVAAALEVEGRPVVISESYDATNSGAPGDSTHLLAELVQADLGDRGALTFCVDPEAVSRCFEAGQGARLKLTVGGKRDTVYCDPLPANATVERLGEVRYRLSGHAGDRLDVSMGRAAVIQAGDATVVLTEQTGPGSSPMLYRSIGVEPREYRIVVAKSPEGFRRDYEPFAAAIRYCVAPGCSTPDLLQVKYRDVSRPLYPLDDMAGLEEASWAGPMRRAGTG